MTDKKLSPNEAMKTQSRGLRGNIAEEYADALTGQVNATNQQLIKFHGIYQQDDRDRREERERKRLEYAYSFMVRLRIPGGDITPQQWVGIQNAADNHANGIVKITTRQTVQFHGIVKAQMKPSMQSFDAMGLDAIAACGDVNRNVVAGANPALSNFHEEVHDFARQISEHLLPRTGAFKEIWLDGEKLEGDEPEEDPLYGKIYLPRKFKIGIAIPPHNETDVYTQDIGLIAIEEGGKFIGFNVLIGGGLGTTHGNEKTYPRLGDLIGFVPKDKTLDACWQIAAVQRDNGNREDRKLSRLKYTVDKMGVEAFKKEVESRMNFTFEAAKPFHFDHRIDPQKWVQDVKGNWFKTIFVENGRVVDEAVYRPKSLLMKLAEEGLCGFRFTANQNVMITHITPENKATVEALLDEYGAIDKDAQNSLVRQEALACVAMNTCPLALAEGQRYMPSLVTKIDTLMEKHGLADQKISFRMTGCPNGCARPYVAEVGFIGKSMGHYNMYIGGGPNGDRLNTLYKEAIDEAEILGTLDELLADYAKNRSEGEAFGDFTQRAYIDKAA